MDRAPDEFLQILQRNLLFVSGKGGVGKTIVSQAIARRLSAQGKKVLWATFEDPLVPVGKTQIGSDSLFHVNVEASQAFEEYAGLLLGGFAKLFVRNALIRKLAQAAPGIHELVLLGKVWFEREHYDHVVVDMPSTGYGIAMFQSVRNFRELFRAGPIHRDAEKMLATFEDASKTGHLIVTLPEEMPIRESLELDGILHSLFPENRSAFLVNRCLSRAFPTAGKPDTAPPKSAGEFIEGRAKLEATNIQIIRENLPGALLQEIGCFLSSETKETGDSVLLHERVIAGIAGLLAEKGL